MKGSCPLFPAKRMGNLKNMQLLKVSTPNGGVYSVDGFLCGLHGNKQNKGGYAHLTERGAEIPGTAKNDCTAVKLAQEGKLKRWFVKTAKAQNYYEITTAILSLEHVQKPVDVGGFWSLARKIFDTWIEKSRGISSGFSR